MILSVQLTSGLIGLSMEVFSLAGSFQEWSIFKSRVTWRALLLLEVDQFECSSSICGTSFLAGLIGFVTVIFNYFWNKVKLLGCIDLPAKEEVHYFIRRLMKQNGSLLMSQEPTF